MGEGKHTQATSQPVRRSSQGDGADICYMVTSMRKQPGGRAYAHTGEYPTTLTCCSQGKNTTWPSPEIGSKQGEREHIQVTIYLRRRSSPHIGENSASKKTQATIQPSKIRNQGGEKLFIHGQKSNLRGCTHLGNHLHHERKQPWGNYEEGR